MTENTARKADTAVVGRRVLACLLDCTLVLALCSAVLQPALTLVESAVWLLVWLLALLLLFCAVYTVYVALMDGSLGQTLGKMALGIEVVRARSGERPGVGRAAIRALTFLGTDQILGLFVMLGSPTHQRPGDIVADTLVVRKEKLR